LTPLLINWAYYLIKKFQIIRNVAYYRSNQQHLYKNVLIKRCTKVILHIYRVCHQFGLTKRVAYFDLFWTEHCFWRQLRQYWRLAWAVNRTTIGKFSLPKSVKRSVALKYKNEIWLRKFFSEKIFFLLQK